jgi:enediyne biosynthesis protein E4
MCALLMPAAGYGQVTFSNVTSQAGVDGVADLGGGSKSRGFSTNFAWADYDADGDLDVYVTNWATARSEAINILYSNDGDGTFTDVRNSAGVASENNGISAAWGDADGDGDLDLYVVNFFEDDEFYRNNGNGTFTEAAAQYGFLGYDDGSNIVAAWSDFDLDGDLDLYVGKYSAPNLCFVNDGSGNFFEVGAQLGIDDIRDTEGVVWVDYDTSGTPDLYIVNREQENTLYKNMGSGQFTEVTATANLNNTEIGRNSAWHDYDADGLFDCYIANIGANALYRNTGTTFENRAAALGVQFDQGGYGWETWDATWGDVDADGDADLYVAGGAEAGDEPNALFLNSGSGFSDVTNSSGALSRGPLNTAACAFVDYDNDGDLDLYIANSPQYNNQGVPVNFGENILYQNSTDANRGLTVRVKGKGVGFSNASGIGARVKVFSQGTLVAHREIRSGIGPLEAYFGLTESATYDVQVIFPGTGSTPQTTSVTVPSIITVEEQ